MVSKTSSNKADNAHDPQYDDLTAIKGIKLARQQWFREVFQVRTYSDLARLSVEEIEARLKSEKQIPSRAKIEGWLTEARRLAKTLEVPPQPKAQIASPKDAWRPIASFVVEFQERITADSSIEQRTKVHYVEADRGTTWAGVEHTELCRWMVEQTTPQTAQLAIEGYTPELRQAIARIRTLSGFEQRPSLRLASPSASTPVVPVTTQRPETRTSSGDWFSEKLQSAVLKAQQLRVPTRK